MNGTYSIVLPEDVISYHGFIIPIRWDKHGILELMPMFPLPSVDIIPEIPEYRYKECKVNNVFNLN